MQDILEGEVEDTTEGNNVDFEDDVDFQAETRSGTSTGDSTNIGDPMMPKNTGGMKKGAKIRAGQQPQQQQPKRKSKASRTNATSRG